MNIIQNTDILYFKRLKRILYNVLHYYSIINVIINIQIFKRNYVLNVLL